DQPASKMSGARTAAALCLLRAAGGQQASVSLTEEHPPLTVFTCTATAACAPERGGLTLDAQYRWVHAAAGDDATKNDVPKNCLSDGAWNKELCPDPAACAKNCAVEGLTKDGYKNTYGISRVDNGFKLEYLTEGRRRLPRAPRGQGGQLQGPRAEEPRDLLRRGRLDPALRPEQHAHPDADGPRWRDGHR
ncbi:unnamed protein product, partial [Prorocentrum cordatum]